MEIGFLLSKVHANMLYKKAVLARESKGVSASTTGSFAPVVHWLKNNIPHFIASHVFTQIFQINLIKGKKKLGNFCIQGQKGLSHILKWFDYYIMFFQHHRDAKITHLNLF